MRCPSSFSFFFFNDTATTEIYTLSLHDALPISGLPGRAPVFGQVPRDCGKEVSGRMKEIYKGWLNFFGAKDLIYLYPITSRRSEEHTSELQSQSNLVCRLLLEKKKTSIVRYDTSPPTASSCVLPSARSSSLRSASLAAPLPPGALLLAWRTTSGSRFGSSVPVS